MVSTNTIVGSSSQSCLFNWFPMLTACQLCLLVAPLYVLSKQDKADIFAVLLVIKILYQD